MKLLDEFNTAQKVAFLIITTVGAILIYVAATTNPTFIL
jgi:replication-associated recombination protein RarA